MFSDLEALKSAATLPPTGCAAPPTMRPLAPHHGDDSQTVRVLISWLHIHSAQLIQL